MCVRCVYCSVTGTQGGIVIACGNWGARSRTAPVAAICGAIVITITEQAGFEGLKLIRLIPFRLCGVTGDTGIARLATTILVRQAVGVLATSNCWGGAVDGLVGD